MSLDENGMAGALSANKPIDAEFCERVGMVEDGNEFNLTFYDVIKPKVTGEVRVNGGEVFVSDGTGDCVWLPPVNTQGRFLHLLAALGIEVPNG